MQVKIITGDNDVTTKAIAIQAGLKGSDQSIDTSVTQLTGSATAASDKTITSTVWSKKSGGTAGITNAGSLTCDISGLTDGEYIFQFQANQSDGQSGTATVKVTVDLNEPPVIEPIPNQTIKLPGNYKFINSN